MSFRTTTRDLLCITVLTMLFITSLPAQEIWEPTPGPYGGAVRDLVALDVQTVLAGTYFGGLYRSDDGGRQWTPAGMEEMAVFVFHRASSSRLFAGCQNEIIVSTDNGSSWRGVVASPEGFIFSIDDDGAGTFFAAGREGLFRSIDDGDAWGHLDAGAEGSQGLCVCVTDQNTVLAGFNNAGLRRSTDGGDSWALADPAFDGEQVQTLARNGRTLVASVWGKGLYISPDNGFTWENRSTGVNDLRVNSILIRDNGDILVGTQAGEIWKSTDLGGSWTQLPSPGDVGPILVIREVDSGTFYCGRGDYGLFRSTDGGQSWVPSSQGIRNIDATGMVVDGSGTLYVAFRSRHLLKSTDHGDTWQEADETYGGRLLGMDASARIYNAMDYRGISVTSDGGTTWNPLGEGLDRPRFYQFAVAPDGHLYAVLRNSPNMHLPPGTNTWQEFGAPLSNVGIGLLQCAGEIVFAFAVGDGLYRSDDGAQSWEKCENGLPGTQFSCITGDTDSVFVSTPEGIFRSLDGGVSWKNYCSSRGRVPKTMMLLPSGELLASYDDGVYILQDPEREWEEFTDGLPRIFIDGFCIGDEGVVYARTRWHGIYRHVFRPVHADSPPLPSAARLEQNHPNPFRDNTVIRFSLERSMSVTLLVTDMLGREVARIADSRRFPAGKHVLPFFATSLPGGIYHLHLLTQDRATRIPIVRLR